MKKTIAVILAAIMALTAIACAGKEQSMPKDEPAATAAPESGSTPEPVPAPESEPVSDEPIVGDWDLCAGSGEESQQSVDLLLAMGMTMSFTFRADGSGSSSIGYAGETETKEFVYTLENGQIVIDGSGTDYSIEDDLLTLDVDGSALVFKRR